MFTSAIFLAAGRGRGRRLPRPLRRRSGVSFVENAVEQALLSCADEVIVVLGRRVAPAREILEPRARLKVVVDNAHTEKRARLLATALRATSRDATAYFVAYADDRAPSSNEIDQFLSAASRAGKPLVLRDGRKRELLPALIDRDLKSELLSDLNDETLRRVVERDPTRLCLVRSGAPVEAHVKRIRVPRALRRRTR